MTAKRLLLVAATFVPLAVLSAGCGIGDAQTRLRTAIDAKKPTLDECYGTALTRDKTTAGEMRLFVNVDETSGVVNQVEISSGPKDPMLTKCIESALAGVKLEPAPAANLKVEYTLRFTPR
jgi:hypothetical protein